MLIIFAQSIKRAMYTIRIGKRIGLRSNSRLSLIFTETNAKINLGLHPFWDEYYIRYDNILLNELLLILNARGMKIYEILQNDPVL